MLCRLSLEERRKVPGMDPNRADIILGGAAIILTLMEQLSADQLKQAKRLKVASDVNAVPPSGVEGVGVNDDAKPIPGTEAVGIGALAVGNIKYRTEAGLFEKMIESEKPVYLDFRDAYALAQKLAG